MPQGKPAGVRCAQLLDDNRCAIFGQPERPAVCGGLQPSPEMCGDGQASAPDEGCTPKFTVKVEDGAVYLDAAELATVATDLTRPIAGPARRTPHGGRVGA